VGKSEGKSPLGDPKRMLVDNDLIYVRGLVWDDIDWIDIAWIETSGGLL
jgi:hypothetical protein